MNGGIFHLVIQNIRRDGRKMLICAFGIALGVGMFVFFLALGKGVQEGILDRIYPINQVELEPAAVSVMGIKSTVGETGISEELIAELEAFPEVVAVYPKAKSHFPARLFGGAEVFGELLKTEAYMDGLPVALGPGGNNPEGLKEGFVDRGEVLSCTSSDECGERGICLDGKCWSQRCEKSAECGDGSLCTRFSCSSDIECAGDENSCVDGLCQFGFCATECKARASLAEANCGLGRYCAGLDCSDENDCPGGACVDGLCTAGYCDHLPCELPRTRDQLSTTKSSRGWVDLEGPGADLADVKSCPEGTYCIPENVDVAGGYCEQPVPVLLSPVLLELFDLIAAPALGLEPLGDGSRVMGVVFHVQYGNSYLSSDRHSTKQVTKKAEVVGISPKAMELGITLPLPYMWRANERLGNVSDRAHFDTVVVDVRNNSEVQAVLTEGEALGLQVTARTREGKKAANLLLLITLALSFVSWLILLVAAVHVSQTFNMMVTRRTREFGILRSVGARAKDLKKMVVLESVMVGGGGGVAGILLAWAIGLAIEALVLSQAVEMSVRPGGFFTLSWLIVTGGLSVGLCFSVLGAWTPAARAAKLDPAVITR